MKSNHHNISIVVADLQYGVATGILQTLSPLRVSLLCVSVFPARCIET